MTLTAGQRIVLVGKYGGIEAQVDAILPNGQYRVTTVNVYEVDGKPTNQFVVESFVAYRIVRPT